jgi:hypothetical protein
MSCLVPSGDCVGPDQASGIVASSQELMGSEPLPPAARAAMLRVLAATAASPGPGQAFYSLGSVTDDPITLPTRP